jgi:hypothetical protein
MLLGHQAEAKLIRQWEKKYRIEMVTDPQMQVAGLRAMESKSSSARATRPCKTGSCWITWLRLD